MRGDRAIIVRAMDDAIVGWSLGAAHLSGYAADEVLGRSLRVLLQPATPDSGGRALLIDKSGTRVPVTWTHTPVHDELGHLIAITDVLSPSAPSRGECAPPDPLRRPAPFADEHPPRATPRTARAPLQVTSEVAPPRDVPDLTFRQVLESLPLLCWVASPDGRCVFLSSRWVAYTGRANELLLDWGWRNVVHPDDYAPTLTALGAPPESDDPTLLHVRIRRHDGEYRWFEVRATALCEGGRLTKWFGAVLDVHEAHLTRQALCEEREHLQRIIAAAPGAFFSYRVAGDGTVSLSHASQACQDMLGESAEALDAGIASFAHVHPDDRAHVQALTDESARTLEAWRMEYRMLSRHRGVIWVEEHSLPVAEPDGAIQWFGFLEDITERKNAEESLRTAQAQLVAALEAGGMGTSRWNVARARMDLHESLLVLFGCQREVARNNTEDFFEFVLADDVADVRAALAASADELSFTYRVRWPDGQQRWLSARGRRERDHVSGADHVMLLHVDTTQQRRANELQLRSQKLEALGTLAGGIAHDFNNMLHAIGGNCALAQQKLASDHPARPLLEAIAIAGDRAADLVRRLLQFSRPGEQRRDVLKLRDIVREALKLVRATVPSRIEIREELGEHDPYVEADATQIHQIMLNLATNASHAIGSASGFLHVRLEPVHIDASTPHAPRVAHSGEFVALHVTDSGLGMDAATAARIFDPFFTTKAVGQGTGLGLSMVHGIMKSLGGSVTVRSAPGEGSTFTLYFPRSEPSLTHDSVPPATRTERVGGRVLFVDDEQILVELGAHTLETLGYEVHPFVHPRDALQAFLAAPEGIDAVITDLAMPELSGFDLAARLLEVRPDLPIVMMSGNVGTDELATARKLGLYDVLIKPVSIEILSRALARALRGAAKPPEG